LQTLPQLDVLFESARTGVRLDLPEALEQAYGGDLWLGPDCVVSNFVESVDGVVAFPEAAKESGGIVSGGSPADRLLMGILRACCDAVLIGAGTLRAAPKDLWFPESIFPDAASLFAELRRALGIAERPTLYVVSGSGRVDRSHPALREGGVLLEGRLQPREILGAIRAAGHRRIVCEGGPGLFAELVAAGWIDELFLTLSPRLFGRWTNDGRKALTDARDLAGAALQLRSVRRNGAHLFLRYGCR
jgi:riboflavin biosynthesis pyrimidine reductase